MLNRTTEALVYTFIVEPKVGNLWSPYAITEIFIPSLRILANRNEARFCEEPRNRNTTVIQIHDAYVRELMVVASLHQRYQAAFREMQETDNFAAAISGKTQQLYRDEFSKFILAYRYKFMFQPIHHGPIEYTDEIYIPSLNILFNETATFTAYDARNKRLERRKEPELDPIEHNMKLIPIEIPKGLADRLKVAAVLRGEAEYAMTKLSTTPYHCEIFTDSSRFLQQFGYVNPHKL